MLFNEVLLSKLDPVLPLLSQLLKNGIHEFHDGIDKVIKDKFTSVQPSVQWKFNEAAWHFIRNNQNNGTGEIEDIHFENVYPLYGAIDIRNSTIERNNALNNDMQVQFTLLISMLEKLKKQSAFGLIDEKIFLAKKWLSDIAGPIFTDQVLVDDSWITISFPSCLILKKAIRFLQKSSTNICSPSTTRPARPLRNGASLKSL